MCMIAVYAHAIFYVIMCFCGLFCDLCHDLIPVYPRQITTALEKCEIEIMWDYVVYFSTWANQVKTFKPFLTVFSLYP